MYNRDPYTFANHTSIPPSIIRPIHSVLRSWDMPNTDYTYTQAFSPTGVLHVIDTPANGREEIHHLHAAMIDPENGPVVDVQHYLDQLFVLPGERKDEEDKKDGRTEVIFTGSVVSYLKDGQQIKAGFASWVILSPCEEKERPGELQVDYWRAFHDTANLVAAIAGLAGN
ncbi:hypothetical protein BDW59DRAFT_113968 [Aspergillus cavernicola]|uniref:SnoaL-like domain-containing protein n=1 Tax=Aspergillus cavernicola TaxID=176166 RepID=A0ABR4HYK5_9EURO